MRLSARLLTLLLLTFGLLLSGCDSDGGGDDSGFPIAGNWEEVADQETPLYLEITSETYVEYETYDPGSCYNEQIWDIVERDGNTYTLEDRDDGETDTFMMTVEGDELTLQAGSDVLVFEETNVDPSELQLCN